MAFRSGQRSPGEVWNFCVSTWSAEVSPQLTNLWEMQPALGRFRAGNVSLIPGELRSEGGEKLGDIRGTRVPQWSDLTHPCCLPALPMGYIVWRKDVPLPPQGLGLAQLTVCCPPPLRVMSSVTAELRWIRHSGMLTPGMMAPGLSGTPLSRVCEGPHCPHKEKCPAKGTTTVQRSCIWLFHLWRLGHGLYREGSMY